MKSFARATKLPSIGGRAAYISDPGRQEEIVLESAPVDWQPYADFEARNQKTNVRNNEGREMMIALPNDWIDLPKAELQERIDTLARATVGEGREYQWAAHWNTARTNLHVHVIFSERQREKEPGRWDRDVYLAADGKIARRKADRAVDSEGNYVLLHRKGELKEGFTAKDSSFKEKGWLHSKKAELKELMADRWGVKFEKQPHLPEAHRGKGSEAAAIGQKNEVTRENNRRLDFIEAQGKPIGQLVADCKAARAEEKTPLVIYSSSDKEYKVTSFTSPERAVGKIEMTASAFVKEQPQAIEAEEAPEKPLEAPESTQRATEAEMAATVEPEAEKPSKAAQRPQEAPERERQWQPQTKAEQLRSAFEDFKSARTKVEAAESKLHHAGDGLKFWQFKAKKAKQQAAGRELLAAERECRNAYDQVTSFGISRYYDGVELNGANLSSAEFASLRQSVERKAEEFERYEAHEAKIRGSGEGMSEAMRRYKEKQKEMAPAVEARLAEKAKAQSQGRVR